MHCNACNVKIFLLIHTNVIFIIEVQVCVDQLTPEGPHDLIFKTDFVSPSFYKVLQARLSSIGLKDYVLKDDGLKDGSSFGNERKEK